MFYVRQSGGTTIKHGRHMKGKVTQKPCQHLTFFLKLLLIRVNLNQIKTVYINQRGKGERESEKIMMIPKKKHRHRCK